MKISVIIYTGKKAIIIVSWQFKYRAYSEVKCGILLQPKLFKCFINTWEFWERIHNPYVKTVLHQCLIWSFLIYHSGIEDTRVEFFFSSNSQSQDFLNRPWNLCFDQNCPVLGRCWLGDGKVKWRQLRYLFV